jgi:hypothetical protein
MKLKSLVFGLVCVGVFCCGTARLLAQDVTPEFTRFAQLAQFAAEKQGANILVKYDAQKRLLQVARQFPVNQFRKMTQIQSVVIDKLEDQAEISGIANMPDPWLKIGSKGQKKIVQLNSTQEINGVEDEDLAKEEHLAFLTLPCHPGELKKLQDAYGEFKKSVNR